MKNKRNLIICIESIVIVILMIVIARSFISRDSSNKGTNNGNNNEQKISLKEVSKELPNFVLFVTGAYNGQITRDELQEKNVRLYEFDATVNTGWTYETDHYIGYKLNDILDAFNINDFLYVEFQSNDGVKVKYEKYMLNDNFFVVFYINDNQIDEGNPPMLLVPHYRSNYSVARLLTMDFGFPSSMLESNSTTTPNQDNKTNE